MSSIVKHLTFLAAALLVILTSFQKIQQVNGQRFAPGFCPQVTPHEHFDKTKFFGNWIEVEKTPSIFDLMMRCMVVDYSDDRDNTVNVVVRGVSLAGLPLTVNGDGLLQDVQKSGYYSIRYGFGVPFQGTLTTIVDTDYDDYAVVYSCTNSLLSGVFHSEYIWVLSRSGKISNPTRQNIYEKLDKLNINRSGLTMSDRSTCPANSTTVGRESDNNLAGQASQIGSGQQASSGSSNAPNASPASTNSASDAQSSQANLEKANAEPTQKSVIVPLLYDLPSPASSSSVGPSKPAKSKENGTDNKSQQSSAAKKPVPASSPSQAPASQQQSPASGANSQTGPSPASGNLLNKIQNKP